MAAKLQDSFEKRAFLTEKCKILSFLLIFSPKSLVVSKNHRTFAPANQK